MTFSIVARDPENGLVGVAVSTALPCVGAACPYAKAGVGAVASQAWTNVRLGVDGLRLLELGLSPEAALMALLQEDAQAARRQAAGIDSRGRVFAYSGDECTPWYGHGTGKNYSVQGNTLGSQETLDAMAEEFERSSGHLARRLLAALEAGQAAGGDKRGRESAALLAPAPEAQAWLGVDIRVDQHPDPIAELRRIFDLLLDRYQRLREEDARQRGHPTGLAS